MADKVDVYQIVTDRIISELENGTVPWRKPWRAVGGDRPTNLVSGKPYRGINQLLLSMSDYTSPYWVTFKQAKLKGGCVRKGEKSTLIVFWKMNRYEDKTTGKEKTIPMLRYYNVFNVEQCDGLTVPEPDERPEFNPCDEADSIINGMPNAPDIQYGGDSAAYVPAWDIVKMPVREAFDSPALFYNTILHELTHSTGAESRLSREGIVQFDKFGSDQYAREELIAEMGAAMLCTVAGVDNTLPASAAYIANWLSALKNDPKMVVAAAGKAQRAADYILDEAEAHEATETRELVAA